MANIGRMVKESIIEELSLHLSERPNVFVASLEKLPASDADMFRRQLHRSQARVVLVKRRLGRLAVQRLELPGVTELLDGSVALVLSTGDVLPTAKALVEFAKSHEAQLALRGAVIDGQLLDRQRVEQLAALPSRPVLLAQVVWTIESPLADVIWTIERLVGDLAWVLEQAAARAPVAPEAQQTT